MLLCVRVCEARYVSEDSCGLTLFLLPSYGTWDVLGSSNLATNAIAH